MSKQRVEFEGDVHLVGLPGDFTLCGVAHDAEHTVKDETEKMIEEDADLDALLIVIETGKGRCEVPHDVALAVEPRCPSCSYDCMDLPTLIENGGWLCQRRSHAYAIVEQEWLSAIAEVREDRQQKRQEAQERADYAAALRRAETARDAALKQSAAWEIQAQDMRDRLIKAEAERDAQHALVLRLTGERDEAKARIDRILDPPIKRMNMANGEINVVLDAPEMARIMATTFWDYLDEHKAKNYVEMCFARPEAPTKRVIVTVRKLIGRTPEELREAVAKERDELLENIKELESTRDLLLTENARLQQQLSRPDPVVHETPVDGVVPCCGQKLHDLKDGARVNEGPLVNCDRMRLLSRVGEVSSANLLLTAENERLQQEHNAYCRKLANDGLTVASRLQRELDAVRAENDTLHYLLRGGQ